MAAQDAEPNCPQPILALTPVAFKSAVVSAGGTDAVPPVKENCVVPATVTRPATTPNLALPSGQRFLIVTCTPAGPMTSSAKSPLRKTWPMQNGNNVPLPISVTRAMLAPVGAGAGTGADGCDATVDGAGGE